MLRFAFFLLLFGSCAQCQPDRILFYTTVGSGSFKEIEKIQVQRALLAAAKAPQPATELNGLLGGAGVTIADLEKLRLLKRDGANYRIAFTLLLADDVRLVRARAEVHARALADSLLARRAEIDAALARYDSPGVGRKDLAFIVLGCFSLDWDGLGLIGANRLGRRPGGRYVPVAEERIDDAYPLFCFSASRRWGKVGVVSFGDGRPVVDSLMPTWANQRDAADLIAMRDGREPATGLALERLEERKYISRTGDRYALNIPVLSPKDAEMVRRLRTIGHDAMGSWLDRDYFRLEAELSQAAPLRAGVPYEEVFTWVWHYIFGRANAMLIQAGLFPDSGYATAVFDTSLVQSSPSRWPGLQRRKRVAR